MLNQSYRKLLKCLYWSAQPQFLFSRFNMFAFTICAKYNNCVRFHSLFNLLFRFAHSCEIRSQCTQTHRIIWTILQAYRSRRLIPFALHYFFYDVYLRVSVCVCVSVCMSVKCITAHSDIPNAVSQSSARFESHLNIGQSILKVAYKLLPSFSCKKTI